MSLRVAHIKQNKTISQYLVTALSFLLFVYFFYHLMHGERGYFAWKGLEEKLQSSQVQYDPDAATAAGP